MSDIGSALVSGLGDLGSSIGNMFSGVGNAMTGSGGDVGTMFGQMAQALSPATSSAASAPAINPAAAAPLTMTPPTEGTPQQQSGDVGGTQSGGAPQQGAAPQQQTPQASSLDEEHARTAGLDAIRKLFQAGRANPYQTGGGVQTAGQGGNDPNLVMGDEGPTPGAPTPKPPRFRWAGGVPYQKQQPQPQSDEPVDIPNFRRPPTPGEAPPAQAAAPDVPPQTRPEIGPGSAAAASGVPPWVSTLAKATPVGVAGAAMTPTPAETGEQPPGGFQSRPGTTIAGPASEVLREGEGGPAAATTTAPDTGKKVETVDPKTKKPVDPKTGDPLPTKTPPLPTKKGGPEPPSRPHYMDQPPPGQSGMMRDVGGMQGVPQMLGALAQIALPLMMGMGGRFGGHHGFGGFPFGRGGHGRFGGGWRGGHPGGFGSGMWPYHHPGMGWRGFPFHPGGQWQPLHPQFGPGGGGMQGGGTGNPITDAISQLLGGGQGGQQGGGGFRQGGGFGAGNDNYSNPVNGPWSGNPFYNAIVGAESGGRNSGAPGGGPAGDNGLARGYFNIQTPTWHDFAPNVPGASRYASADQAPYEIQRAVANTIPIYRFGDRTKRILHAQFGNFDENMTVGQMADRAGGVQTAGNIPTSGVPTTPTGDTRVASQ